MDTYEELRRKAAEKRDVAIKRARAEYRETIGRIAAVARAVAPPRTAPPQEKRAVAPPKGKAYLYLTPIQAAEIVLREGKALTLAELTVEIQSRGCRANDNPRRVANTLRGCLIYHRARFTLGDDGRWAILSVASDNLPPS
jgi:hypothetical protein